MSLVLVSTLEVFEVVDESRALIAIGGCTGCLHTIGHAWRSTGEDSNAGQQDVVLLEAVKELVEIWTTKVSHRAQSSEQTPARQLLEVPLTDVLCTKIV